MRTNHLLGGDLMVFSARLPLAVLLALCLLSFLGCGEKTVIETKVSKLESSQRCIDCHGTTSKVTGKSIADEWKLSGHNVKNGASCGDCHEPHQSHPNAGNCDRCHGGTTVSGPDVTVNADAAGKCSKCHTKNGGFGSSNIYGATIDGLRVHFNNITSSKYPASYVSSTYEKNCRSCHNPHDTATAKPYLQQWSRSGHGDINASARILYDFKTAGSYKTADQEFTDTTQRAVCLRCHTSTGYLNYVNSNFTDLKPFAGPGFPVVKYDYNKPPTDNSKVSRDLTREVTACNVCHDDGKGAAYSYKLRNIVAKGKGIPVYYNYSGSKDSGISQGIRNNKVVFPDAGPSNICVVCHSGRENGEVIKLAAVRNLNFANVSRIGAHDRAAAAVMFRKAGFEYYSSSKMYSSTSFMHDIIGMDTTRTNTATTPLTFSGKNADARLLGPCIGCHMNSTTTHTFKTFEGTDSSWTSDVSQPFPDTNKITAIPTKTCINCHDDTKVPKLEDTWTIDSIQIEKDRYRATLNAFWYVIQHTLTSNNAPKDATKPIGPANAKFNPTGLTHWYRSDSITETKAVVATWLQNNDLNSNSRMSFYDPILGSQSLKNGAFSMGAVFNYTMLVADPGAYAHNRRYVKKLIYDSIDWLDDGVMNQSVYYTFAENVPKDFNTEVPTNPGYTLDLKAMIGAADYALAGRYLGFTNRTTGAWAKAGRLSN